MKADRIALPVRDGRLSPVFDTAQRMLMVDVSGGAVQTRSETSLPEQSPRARADRLSSERVNVLLCGAISRSLMALLSARNVRVVPMVVGELEDVLAAYLGGRIPASEFMMPGGCRRCYGQPSRHRQRQRRTGP